RFAGEGATDADNNAKLLAEMQGVPEDRRTARFVCWMVAMAPGGESLEAQGRWEGRIATAPQGEQGFGYDPLFFDPEQGRTSAQLSREEKNQRSHRGKALRQLLEQWPGFWASLEG
ncbi:MAG: non-canonical purine NTP pyrophosphatase, partial [Desulfovibrionaceae bacterium]